MVIAAIVSRTPIVEHRCRAPFAPAFMARALLPSPRLAQRDRFPRLVQRWSGVRIEASHWAGFCAATGGRPQEAIPVLYPHVLGFRLQMALLTHPAFPLPIWGALQVRNHLVRHARIDPLDTFELETGVEGHRPLAKGLEVDLYSRLSRGTACMWESRVSYFYRGRFDADPSVAPPLLPPPDLSQAPLVERWRMPHGGGWRFGALTGDYNGIHWSDWYARRFGFRAAFAYPQRVAGLCMAKLRGPPSDAQTLDLWIRGPVFYGADVELAADTGHDGLRFGLSLADDPRRAIIGSWRQGAALD